MTSKNTLGTVGERAALARIFPRLPAATTTLVGPGDDAAVLAAPDGRFVVTTDMMIHGPDFRLAWSTAHDLGVKAAASNLADVAAMGAVPTSLVVALAVPRSTSVEWLEQFADGLRDGVTALADGCGVVGGDLSVSDTLTIVVTAFGDLQGRAPVLRSGARTGDVVAVAGALGMAGAGIRLLFTEAVTSGDGSTPPEPSADLGRALRRRYPAVLDAQLAPTPPIHRGPEAADAGATAMLDVSDGLLLDASRIAEASAVGIDLSSAALDDDVRAVAAAHPSLADFARGLVYAGGEDHALLATFPASGALPDGFRRIGVVVPAAAGGPAGAGSAVTVDGAPYDSPGGWDPYRDWNGSTG
ncbi:thiamine-phosphate kinase [Planctomonas psychrotolerans]|uniref:thiamine-phosphate kinase n=1 Tax=Planctomonas psychrotolerans TaxID=2528712 RepID=UPI00123BEB89|nr:thiamine-phosphate kinase [Planctomonas psychrotolerans]